MYEAIDYAVGLGFDVLAHTCHHKVIKNDSYKAYAEQRGVLLIEGVELTIENSHVLILNAKNDIERVSSLKELRDYRHKNPQILIVAPHPYYFFFSLGKKLEKNADLFDAIEWSWFYTKCFNFPNKKAERVSKKLNIPLLATSDTHIPNVLEKSFAKVEAEEKSVEAVIKAIKNGAITNVSAPSKFFSEAVPYVFKMVSGRY